MTQDDAKRMAARQALEFVEDGMLLGLGSGSTSRMFIQELGERVKQGLRVRGIATSTSSRELAESLSIPIITFDEFPVLDLAVDGADEVGPGLALIKGGGGALLWEKIVAAASARMIVIADDTKWVPELGHFPLPIEVVPFGLAATRRAVEFVQPGMRLGLGTGSTARHFVELLGARVRDGLSVIAVPTSEATRAHAAQFGIPLSTLDETPELDLTVDEIGRAHV